MKQKTPIDAQFTIGQKIPEGGRRDAVHFALFPAGAATVLQPGEAVGVDEHGNADCTLDAIGIVDPFLPDNVEPGDHFWIFLYPNTITSLRHEWTHPAFDGGVVEETEAIIKSASIAWLKEFASEIDLPYDTLIDALDTYEKTGTPFIFQGVDTPSLCYEGRREMWQHYEIVTGRGVENRNEVPFSCAC